MSEDIGALTKRFAEQEIHKKIEEMIELGMDYDTIEINRPEILENWQMIKDDMESEIYKNDTVKDIIRNIIYYIQRKYSQKQLKESKFKKLELKELEEDEVFEILDMSK